MDERIRERDRGGGLMRGSRKRRRHMREKEGKERREITKTNWDGKRSKRGEKDDAMK